MKYVSLFARFGRSVVFGSPTNDLQRQKTIEPDRDLDDVGGEFAFASFAGIRGIDQNVGVEPETFSEC